MCNKTVLFSPQKLPFYVMKEPLQQCKPWLLAVQKGIFSITEGHIRHV